jgi:hypothetical protein
MRRLITIAGIVLAAALACSLPSVTTPSVQLGDAQTLAAQTVGSFLTQNVTAGTTGEATQPPTETFTAEPANVPATLTPTLIPPSATTICNQASFVEDVSVPDGTTLQVNEHFTKTWRLKNVGSCAWTSGYQLVFDHGDKMSGPDSKQLTTGVINPGQNIDVSVDLVAPSSAGNYKGYWMLREPGGAIFGLSTGAFWVDIQTANPTLIPLTLVPLPHLTLVGPLPHPINSINAPVINGQSGSVRSDGSVLSVKNAGDLASNVSSRVYLTFDISGIPAGSNIMSVKTDFSNYDTLGNPFGGLSCLRMYRMNYGSLNAADYGAAPSLGSDSRWCNTGELSAVSGTDALKTEVQNKVGSSTIQFVVYFNSTATDHDGVSDMVRLGNGIKLVISFQAP